MTKHKILLTDKFTFKYIWKYLKKRWEKINGLDFLTTVYSKDIGFDPDIIYNSEPTDRKYLKKVLNQLKIIASDSIIDIGCGKGNAMLIMSKFLFYQVDGIEISSILGEIALNNFKNLKIKSKVFITDVINFKNYDSYNYFYLNNPFNSLTMKVMLVNLIDSINRNPRKVTIIYYCPGCHKDIIDTQYFFKISGYRYKNLSPMWVYSNKK